MRVWNTAEVDLPFVPRIAQRPVAERRRQRLHGLRTGLSQLVPAVCCRLLYTGIRVGQRRQCRQDLRMRYQQENATLGSAGERCTR
jgi:hypothetical protein